MIKRIAVKDLKLGMFVQELHGSWIKHPFWKTKFLLEAPGDLALLQTCGIGEISIDLSRSVGIKRSVPTPLLAQPAISEEKDLPPIPDDSDHTHVKKVKVSFNQEIDRARDLCNRSKLAVIDMFREARMGQSVSMETANEVIDQIAASVDRHPQALITLARLKTSDDYTYMHSVAVCAMMVALARELGLKPSDVRKAGMAGLLHDVGKMAVPDGILNKPGSLTDSEFTVVKSHPVKGAEILAMAGDVSAEIIDVCLHHHEKYDGSGYPHKLKGEQITSLARMGAICDVYDAITSNRPYKKGWGPAESLQRMAKWEGHFDPIFFQAFIKAIGLYPTGSLVRLSSQRLAVVIDQNEGNMLKPKVKVFFSLKSMLQVQHSVIDLSAANNIDSIEARESHEKWKFPYLDELWQTE
jgi:putative nucleotidyltransferase with HDIG domain